ncbi:MAG: hypothetical protein IKO49_07945 [Bacilli bacterium]|nr:hypothetical protein [Bacilli bacterium]
MNEEEKKNESIYSIPGVIIPEQTTDSGVVIKTDNSNTVEEKKEENQEEEKKESVYSIPGVIIPEQTTDSGKVEQINNVTPENVYKAFEKEVVDTSTIPIMPGMMPEEKNVENKQVDKPKKVKREGNAKVGMLEVLVIVLTIAVFYFVFITYINPPKLSSDDYIAMNKQVFNKKGYVISELYDWVNVSGCNGLNEAIYNSLDVVKVGDLKDEEKLYFAYLQIKNKDILENNCSSYSNVIHSNNINQSWYCGESFGVDDTNAVTSTIDSKILKKQVLKMFGPGEYRAKTFNISDGSRYFYDSSSDLYILQTSDINTTCSNISTKLNSVENYSGQVIINVSVKFGNNSEEIRKVRFLKSSDGNYYFDQVSKS